MRDTTDFYSIPRLYDILHAPGTPGEVRVLARLARAFGARAPGPPVWLEPACGTARYLRRAAGLGVRGIGFDSEARMVRFAKRAARGDAPARGGVRVFQARMEAFTLGRRLPRVHFAFNLINSIRHLETDRAMLAHFAEIARVLHPDGAYSVGLSLCAYGLENPTEDTWTARGDGAKVTQVVQYLPPTGGRGKAARAERVISHLTVRARGAEDEHITSTYTLRGYSLAQWTTLVERSALRVHAVTDSQGRAASASEPGYFVFVLKPRAVSGSSPSGSGGRRSRRSAR